MYVNMMWNRLALDFNTGTIILRLELYWVNVNFVLCVAVLQKLIYR